MNSLLNRVSLSGVDESIPLEFMTQLSEEFSFIEWAFPYLTTKNGAARKASEEWLGKCFSHPANFSVAIHLYEPQSFEKLLRNELPPHLLKANRLQLNVNLKSEDFNDGQLIDIYKKALDLGPSIVFPRHELTFKAVDDFLSKLSTQELTRVSVLAGESQKEGFVSEVLNYPLVLEERGVEIVFLCRMNRDLVKQALPEVEALKIPYAFDMTSNIAPYNSAMKRATRLTLEVFQDWLKTSGAR